jgi:putative ABC transport system permease protein
VLRLVVNDLVDNLRIWLGALFVAAAAAAALSVAVGLLQTSVGLTLNETLGLSVLASLVLVFSVIACGVVLGSVTRLTVTLQRRSYALWQLVGASAFSVVTVVRAQLVLVALVGAVIGCALAGPFVPGFIDEGLSASNGLQDVPGRFDLVGALVVVLAVTVVVWLSGLRPSRRAGRVRAIEVLRDPSPAEAGMTWLRWVVAALALVLAVAMTTSLAPGGTLSSGTQVLLIGPVFTAAAAALGPVLFPLVLRTWTRLVPDRVAPSWFLARTTVAYDLSRSSATVSNLLVAIALPGSIYAGFFTFGRAVEIVTGTEASALAPQSFLLILSGALLVSLSGSAATVYMSSRARDRESALVRSAGGTPGVVIARAGWESLMHVVTAVISAALVLIVTGVGEAWALNAAAPGTAPAFGVAAAGTAAVAGLVLVLAAGLGPTIVSSRRSIPGALAAE